MRKDKKRGKNKEIDKKCYLSLRKMVRVGVRTHDPKI